MLYSHLPPIDISWCLVRSEQAGFVAGRGRLYPPVRIVDTPCCSSHRGIIPSRKKTLRHFPLLPVIANLDIIQTRPGPIPTGIAASPSWTPMRTGPSSIENSLSRQTVAKPRTSKIRMDKPTTTSTPSTDRPTSKSKDIMADITCNDPMKVKRALNALDPAQVLRDLENPYRPRWTEILDDWAEVDMPRLIFERWEVRQLERDDSVYWEYDAKRQRLGVRCLPTAIHEAAPDAFRARAFKEVSQLSSESQDVFKIGSNTGMYFPSENQTRSRRRLLRDDQSLMASTFRGSQSIAKKSQMRTSNPRKGSSRW